jgi:PAS domain S-box-containing protein
VFERKSSLSINELSVTDMQKLIHELEVHQIELDIQNDELFKASLAAQKALDLYDYAPSGYFSLTKSGEIILLNFAGASLLGKERSYLKNKRFGLFVSEDSKPVFNHFLGSVFKGNLKENCELCVLSDNDKLKYIHLIGTLSQNKDECLITAIDITERKQNSLILSKSEIKYHELFENTLMSISIVDLHGFLVQANMAYARMYGYNTPDEMIKLGINVGQFYAKPEQRTELLQILQKEDKMMPREVEVMRRDGTHFFVLVSASLIKDENGKSIYYQAHHIDITDRKLADKALIESEKISRSVIELSPIPMAMNDNQQNITYINAAFIKTFGYTIEDIPTLSQWWPRAYPDVEYRKWVADKWFEEIEQAKHSGEAFLPMEVNMQCKNGSKKIVLVSATSLSGTFQNNHLVVFYDITERKKTEVEINHKNEELLKMNAEKDKFFSIIAHDLRGPFNSFLGLTQIMSEELSGFTMLEIQHFAASMQKSADNLFRLLENLLEWARMQQGLIPFHPEYLHLQFTVNESLDVKKESAKSKQIEILSSVSDDLKVFADTNMLQYIIRNLVSNAVKFTPRGGSISIAAKLTLDDLVEVSINDTGIGLNPVMIENLFKLDVNTSRKGTEGELSTGLGLILCKEFIEKNGGEMRVESEEGKGSTFFFTLAYGKN